MDRKGIEVTPDSAGLSCTIPVLDCRLDGETGVLEGLQTEAASCLLGAERGTLRSGGCEK